MSRKIAFVGYGELGKQYHTFLEIKEFDNVVYFDDFLFDLKNSKAMPFKAYISDSFEDFSYYIALGYKHLKLKKNIIEELGTAILPESIHQSAYVSPAATIEKAVFVYPMSNIDKGVRIGFGSLLNNSSVVSHDCTIGACCYISPGVVLSGQVSVGDCTFIGTGSVVANGINIGKNVTIGIGTVVTKNIPDNSIVIGNPMRFLSNKLEII
jgi:sugar O-acyltransferase (sialic acid O-acetyltransferase NeuD family)